MRRRGVSIGTVGLGVFEHALDVAPCVELGLNIAEQCWVGVVPVLIEEFGDALDVLVALLVSPVTQAIDFGGIVAVDGFLEGLADFEDVDEEAVGEEFVVGV